MARKKNRRFFQVVFYVVWGAKSVFKLCHLEKLERSKEFQNKTWFPSKTGYNIPTLFLWVQFWPNSLLTWVFRRWIQISTFLPRKIGVFKENSKTKSLLLKMGNKILTLFLCVQFWPNTIFTCTFGCWKRIWINFFDISLFQH